MTTIWKLVLTALFLFSISSAASAQANAGKVASLCEHSASAIGGLKTVEMGDMYCTGLFSGWRDVIDRLPVLTPNRNSRIQIEQTATNGQLIRVFVAYIKAHPEAENKDAFIVFSLATREAGLMKIAEITKEAK
jgi:hypothetical protein